MTLTFSVLLTREEYVAYSAALRARRRGSMAWTTWLGAGLSAAGLVGLFFGGAIGLYPAVAAAVTALGVALVCFEGGIAPLFDRAAAGSEYDTRQQRRLASVYTFTPDAVEVRNDWQQGALPLELAAVVRAPGLIGLSFGREADVVIPLRLLHDESKTAMEKICAGIEKK